MPRPRGNESRARTRELLRLLAAGATLTDAARGARVDAGRVLRLFERDEFLAVYLAVRDGTLGPTAAIAVFDEFEHAA